MRLAIQRRLTTPQAGTWLTQVVPPRTNQATLASAENMLAALVSGEPFGLEIASDAHQRRFLVRAGSPNAHQQLCSQLSAAYPQSELRVVESSADPAVTRDGEGSLTSVLRLRAPSYLPIRTFTDLDLDGERAAQADPVLGILTALGNVPTDWRGLVQFVLSPAPENWSRSDARRAVQHPLESERITARSDNGAAGPLAFFAVVLALIAFGFQLRAWWHDGAWLMAATAALGGLAVVGTTVAVIRRFARPSVYDMDLVREKVSRVAFRVCVRVTVFAPQHVQACDIAAELHKISSAFRRYNLATANGFVSRTPLRVRDEQRTGCSVHTHGAGKTLLTVRELAGMWHMPHAAADVVLLERTTARQWLPLPARVADGCRIGESTHQGQSVPVALPPDVLQRHALLVAKTRRGKSTLMLRLIAHAARSQNAVLLIDPHVDLARDAVGVMLEARADNVIYLDLANAERPFGLNPLDTGLGWSRDAAVAHTLVVFQREWGDRYWGPRMEDAFRFALITLFDANVTICASDPIGGRARQYTLLDIPPLLTDFAFRRNVLSAITDHSVRAWWAEYYDGLDKRLQQEVANPILSKIHRFDGSVAARQIIGQAASTIDPAGWVRDRKIVLVSTARGTIGENAAALIGSTLLNLTALAVAAQADLAPAARARVSFFVDEFHTIPGADYETMLSELGKYGANVVLATQSLARLRTFGRDEDGQGLRATVFANLDALFAFNCSAEDAEYLVPELGGHIDVQDLIEMADHQCYVRLSSGHRRLPVFSVQLDPPLATDTACANALMRQSEARYGRPAADVQAERQSAAARIALAHLPSMVQQHQTHTDQAQPRRRNQNRPRKRRPSSVSVDSLQTPVEGEVQAYA